MINTMSIPSTTVAAFFFFHGIVFYRWVIWKYCSVQGAQDICTITSFPVLCRPTTYCRVMVPEATLAPCNPNQFLMPFSRQTRVEAQHCLVIGSIVNLKWCRLDKTTKWTFKDLHVSVYYAFSWDSEPWSHENISQVRMSINQVRMWYHSCFIIQ